MDNDTRLAQLFIRRVLFGLEVTMGRQMICVFMVPQTVIMLCQQAGGNFFIKTLQTRQLPVLIQLMLVVIQLLFHQVQSALHKQYVAVVPQLVLLAQLPLIVQGVL